MADQQLLIHRGASTVIQGNRLDIVSELEKLSDNEELTLIIPGKEVEPRAFGHGDSFDDVFGPLQAGFEASGMTEDELDSFVDSEVKTVRNARRSSQSK